MTEFAKQIRSWLHRNKYSAFSEKNLDNSIKKEIGRGKDCVNLSKP